MIKQDFSPKPFWKFGVAVTAISLMTACGSQSLTETTESGSVDTYSMTDSSTSHDAQSGAYDSSYQEDKDELIGYGLTTSANESSATELDDFSTESRGSDANDALQVTDGNNQQNITSPGLEEDKDMTVLVLDDTVMAALEAQNGNQFDQEVDRLMTIEPPQPRIIYYGFDQSTLDPIQKADIRKHADFLAVHPNYHIQLHGHTDKQGYPAYNEKLAKERAQRVADELIAAGVKQEQIEIFAWGSRDPLLSSAQHDRNRRVEMIYLNDQVAFGKNDTHTDSTNQVVGFVD